MAKTGKELRVQIPPVMHDLVLASAKARRTTPARVVADALMMQLHLLPQMTDAISALEAARRDGDRIGAIRDFIADLYAAEDTEEDR